MVCRATEADSEENRVALENKGRAMVQPRSMSGAPRRCWGGGGTARRQKKKNFTVSAPNSDAATAVAMQVSRCKRYHATQERRAFAAAVAWPGTVPHLARPWAWPVRGTCIYIYVIGVQEGCIKQKNVTIAAQDTEVRPRQRRYPGPKWDPHRGRSIQDTGGSIQDTGGSIQFV
jgi:hypothetical protein